MNGKIITPAKAKNPSKGSFIGIARVYASTDPSNKIAVNSTNGSYSLKVTHKGSFTLTAEYTGTDGNYKTSDAKPVKTTNEKLEKQNIALKYGRTITIEGGVSLAAGGNPPNGATVIAEVEGVEVANAKTEMRNGGNGNYLIEVPHNGGNIIIKASYNSSSGSLNPFRARGRTSLAGQNITLRT